MFATYYESEYEQAFVQLLTEAGWCYKPGDSIHRKYSETLLEKDLRHFLLTNYQAENLTENEVSRIISNLRNTSGATDYLALRAVSTLYREGFTFDRDDQAKPSIHIDYINFDKVEANIFTVVNQMTIEERKERRIPDVLLFVNGIPVCIIELKNPAKAEATIFDAWEQIHIRYIRDISSLMKYCVLSCLSDGGTSRLGTSYTPFEHYYAWKKVQNEDAASAALGEIKTLIFGALTPHRLLKILRDFVYFPDVQIGQQKETAIVCRYPQFFATQKLHQNILTHMRRDSGGDGKGGTYFGATGCGKTFTMLFLARQMMKRSVMNPTVLIIVDREDLETQAGSLFTSSTDFIGDGAVRVIESRADLKKELQARQSGGVFITTVQKFCEETGLLSERSNIFCFSDEAHRTQTALGEKVKVVAPTRAKDGKGGVYTYYGFAQHLRDAFPKATYVGFTGTPIDETIHVFGDVVDQYTMQQSVEDGITVPLKYEARLARVLLDSQKAKEIETYYRRCQDEGADEESIEESKRAMTSIELILGDEDRLERLAKDVIEHYESYTAEKPDVVQKAMIVCSTRKIAYKLYKKMKNIQPAWFEKRRVVDENLFDTPEKKAELQTYVALPMVNIVATRSKNDEKEMYDLLGEKSYRQMLDREFKKTQSNFRIAIVVDMWITGFDVPCLSILYNDKPLQRHTLIQTISRVNRKYKGKDCGLIVDYIGIRENMKKALKAYGGDGGDVVDDVEATYNVFVNELQILKDQTHGIDASGFFSNEPMRRLQCLQNALEFVFAQPSIGTDKNATTFVTWFKVHTSRLKAAYAICHTAGRLSEDEIMWANFFMATRGLIQKVRGDGPSVETMNKIVEGMVDEALMCGGVETVLYAETQEDVFSDDFSKEVRDVKLPFTKFEVLLKLLKRTIKEYKHTNKLKGALFEEQLQQVVDEYNTRDKLVFANEVATGTVNAIQGVVESVLNGLTDKLMALFADVKKDKIKFTKLGVSFEEMAFYDILIDQRNIHKFEYDDARCLALAKKIKALIDQSSVYADWLNNDNLKADLSVEMTKLLYKEGYPPEWDEEVFTKVMEQVENFKTYH